MGGGAMHMDLNPLVQFKPSPSALPSLPSPSSANFPVSDSVYNITAASIGQSCTASCCYCPGGSCIRLEHVVQTGKDDRDKRTNNGCSYNVIFGTVPSQLEVESAIASLQNFAQGISSPEIEFNQLQQILDSHGFGTLLSNGSYGRVRDAFNLLQTDPSVKRLVISLASDKAVWDAVMNNEAVRELQESCYPAAKDRRKASYEEPDMATRILQWILDITRAKVIELIDKFTLLVNEVFQPLEKEKPREETRHKADDKVRSSLLLSVVILLIVVVARTRGV